MDKRPWKRQIEQQRAARDRWMRDAPESPIDDPAFRGLAYYPPDVGFRLVLALQRSSPETVTLPRTGGDTVAYQRVGTFDINVPTGSASLAAFRAVHGNDLWVPFQDATNGTETYGAGRSVEATPVRSGRWLLDLNLASHPLCAYDDRFTCPLVPAENRLAFPVPAGERLA